MIYSIFLDIADDLIFKYEELKSVVHLILVFKEKS